ncbi:MAG: tRNA threonylcarbamoyladenosine dehydratase, partial [Spirochaetia bacterium]|nr:tRNA threonylcarbamoyladenosine dehydratase [Spirochaetia bacterium]
MKPEQFLRITRLLGEESVQLLHQKRVVLVGLGAVGGMALEALVRSGVGNLRIVDFDTIGITNLNRQILATHDTLGKLKTEVAQARVKAINPYCNIEALPLFVQEDTLDDILSGPIDLVIDAIDSLNPKCALLQRAYERTIPIISSMGAALRRDPALIRRADLMDSWGCPLAR